MPRCVEDDHEQGSLILAMMLTIMLLALGSLMAGVLLAQARTTRHDQTFTDVLPAADASIARGLFMLNNGLAAALPLPAAPATLSLGGQTADWYATPVAHLGAPTSYQFSATTRGLARRLSAEAYQSSRFGLAAFSNTSLTMRGGNSASSYNSVNGTRNSTGRGVVGSNGSVTLNGNATADGVNLWNWANDPNPSRCSG